MKTEEELVRAYKNGDVVERAVAFEALKDIAAEKHLKALAPPGEIPGLPPLLEARRRECGIPNGAFKIQAAFDICFVWQIAWFEGDKIPGTNLYMTDNTRKRVQEEAPRGVLLSAGLKALDCLRSNGIDIGHIVSLIRLAPWRMPVEIIGGKEQPVLILRAGDITGSEDLRKAIVEGKCRIHYDEESGEHHYVDEHGKQWRPAVPFLPEDY